MPAHRSVRRLARLALLIMLLAAAAPLPAALAQSPFESLPSAPSTQTVQTATQIDNSSTTSGGLENWQAVLIAVAAVVVLTGAVWVILRDARRVAPADDASHAAHLPADAHKGGRAAKQKQRQRAKAARAQRRRNR